MNTKRIAQIIITSDRSYSGTREDKTYPGLKNLLEKTDFTVLPVIILPDDRKMIADTLLQSIDESNVDLILTSGGTGLGPRDVTVEATTDVMEKEVPGLAEYMRMKSSDITINALLSRAKAAARKKSLIINLPGSPKGAQENLQWILNAIPHALDMIAGGDH